MRKPLVVLLVLLAGCDLYWNHNQDDVCNDANYGATPPSYQARDPQTGQCEYVGGGGGGYCGCGPCPEGAGTIAPNWPSCYGACASITDAATCESTAGCHAAFLSGDVAIGDRAPGFFGCFDIQPLPVLQGGSCPTFDATTCLQHDDCISNYAPSSTDSTTFASCASEGTTTDPCAAIDCGIGSHCESQCYPCDTPGPNGCMDTCSAMCVSDTLCANVDCGPGYTCAEVCSGGGNTGELGVCQTVCEPTGNDPGACSGSVTCNSAPPACPANTTPGIANGCYTGYCIPLSDCGPKDPGTCTGQVSCASAPPACPANTTPGIKNGCWSGYCIPNAACPLAACETLTTEAACSARTDCLPVYDGSDCTCYPDGHCECQVVTYARCESLVMPL